MTAAAELDDEPATVRLRVSRASIAVTTAAMSSSPWPCSTAASKWPRMASIKA